MRAVGRAAGTGGRWGSAAQEPVGRGAAGVEGGEDQQVGPGGGQAGQRGVVPLDQGVDVDAGSQDVVGPGVDGDEVGVEGDLHLADEQAGQDLGDRHEVTLT